MLWDQNPSVRELAGRYVRSRPVNYGMYLKSYRQHHGTEWNSRNGALMRCRIEAGIATGGWTPDCTAPLGALRWYCRAEEGGNPGLAELYRPILERYFDA